MKSKRNTDVLIEDQLFTDPRTGVEIMNKLCFTVWADKDKKSCIENVEGVEWAYQDSFIKTNYTVYYDQRYDRESIKREVEAAIKCD